MPSFKHPWKNQEMSDVDVVLALQGEEQQQQHLTSFPGHQIILSTSPFMRAAILRWLQQPPPEEPVQKQMRTDASSSIRAASSRTQLVLTLQTEDEERIALLVLSAMYAVQPLPDLLAALSQKQLLQATVLADMWQVPDLGVAAVEKLLTAPDLSEETVRLFLQLPAELPAVLRPLVGKVVEAAREQHVGSPADAKRLLLNVFGDLEAVLASSTLSELLWKLSVSAMKLLLSCDALKVELEDTVLFVVWQCSQEVQEQLLPLVRCPHLSEMWVLFLIDQASAAPRNTPSRQLLPQLRKLMKLCSSAGFLSPSNISELMPATPGSWLLGERASSDVTSVCFTWNVSISSLQGAVQRSVSGAGRIGSVESPGQSAPVHGVPFKIKVMCNSGKIGIYALPQLPPDFAICYEFQLEAAGKRQRRVTAIANAAGRGLPDFSAWAKRLAAGMMQPGRPGPASSS